MNSSQRPFENETQQGLPFGRGSTDPHALSNACRQLSTKLGRSLLAEALKGPALLDLLREAIEEIARGHASRTVHPGSAHAALPAPSTSSRAAESVDSSNHLGTTPVHYDVSGAPALWTAGLWAPSEPLPPSLETTPDRGAAQERQTETEEDSSRDSDSDADAEREIEETVEASRPSHLEQLTAAHDISALLEPALRSTLEAFESEADDEPAPTTDVAAPRELTPAEAKAMFEDELPASPAETVDSEVHAETTTPTSAEHEPTLTSPVKEDETAHTGEHALEPSTALESTPVVAQDSEHGSEPFEQDWLFEDSLLDSDLSFLGAAEEESFGLIDPDATLSDDEPSPGGLIPSFQEMFAGLVGDDENLEVSQLLDGNDSDLGSFGLGDDDRAPIETTGATPVSEADQHTEALSPADPVRAEQPAEPTTDTYLGEQTESLFLDPEALGALESDAFEDFTPTPFGDADMDESWALDWEAGWNDSDWATAIPGDAESHSTSEAQITASTNGAHRASSNGVDPQFEDWTALRHDLESNIEEALHLVRNELPDTLDEMLDDIDETRGGSGGGAFDDEVGSDDASVWMPPRWDVVDQFQDDPEMSPSHEPSTLALLDDAPIAPSHTKNEGPTIEELHAALESGKVSDRSTAEMQSLLDELRGVVTADQNELGHVASNVGYLRSELQVLRDDVEASGRVSAELLNRMIALNETGNATESQPAPSLVPTVLAAMGMGLVLSTWTLFFYYRSRDFRLALGCLIIANLVGFAFLLASFAKGPKTPQTR